MPDRLLVRRFDRLCEHLAANRDRFATRSFSELDRDAPFPAPAPSPTILRGRLLRTASRYAEQLVRRLG
jgi:hypothetical protein